MDYTLPENGGQGLRVHRLLIGSLANGPGRRAVLWLQGCTLGCPGCFNPATHSRGGGEWLAVDTVFGRLAAHTDTLEGVTFSGGEPLQQARPLLALLRRLRQETDLSLLMFTGCTWQEVLAMPEGPDVLAYLDVVVAGRYVAGQRLAQGLRGSANQTVHLISRRYSFSDVEAVPQAEVIINGDGRVDVSGIDPPRFDPFP